MYFKKLVNLALFICICVTAVNSTLLAEPVLPVDISTPVSGNLYINNDWDNPNSSTDYDFVNFLPGAATEGFIHVNAGGEVHLYGGTFTSEFGSGFEGWYEMSVLASTDENPDPIVTVHGKKFWVGSTEINPETNPSIDINSYTAGDYGYHNVKWEHPDGTIYNIWMESNVQINLSTAPFQTPNQAPVADAGGPYAADSVDGGSVSVELTAAASTDPDGSVAEWKWDLDNDGTYETSAQTVSSSFPVGTSTVGLVVVDDLGLQSEPVTTTVTVTKLNPEINVYPETLAHDYGDIEVGQTKTFIVQIVNSGQGNLNISSIALTGSSDFEITAEPNAVNGVVVIAPSEIASTDIEITFTPSTDQIVVATLTIVSDDADESSVAVTLSGKGVIVNVPVEQQIANAIAFYNDSIDDGTIVGYAPHANAKTAANRVKALRNMLQAAGTLIEVGETETAIVQLESIAKKTDGQKSPPDFIVGDGVAQLNQMINDIIEALSL